MKPKCILLGGFAGCGKTTIARKYAAEHPLALSIEGDDIIVSLGQWRENIEEAVECKLALTTALAETHLQRGHDVIIPFLLTDEHSANYFEALAQKCRADFYEVTLNVEKDEALRRLFKRGTWGEEGLPPLTAADKPKAGHLYAKMQAVTMLRPQMQYISAKEGDIEGTYKELLSIVS
jgi:predicted kinase